MVVPGFPHYITQRGVRSIPIFDHDGDRELYLSLMREHADRQGVQFQAWCLMTNHVHLIAVPEREDSLARAIGEAHRLYTRAKNFHDGVRGYLFQGRFGSCVMDDPHLVRAARYVELNPVCAGIVAKPEDYAWSSARLHMGRRRTDPLGTDDRVVEIMGDWRGFLREGVAAEDESLPRHVSSGRPWADAGFVRRLERKLGRTLTRGKGGWPKGVPRRKKRPRPRPSN